MCKDFVCEKSGKCINEPICADVRCIAFLSSPCKICLLRKACKGKSSENCRLTHS